MAMKQTQALLLSTDHFVYFSFLCLLISLLLGLGNGAVFKMVPEVSSGNTGAVTGIVGFSPPIVLGFVKDMTGQYNLGFIFMMIFALICLILNFFSQRTKQTEVKKDMTFTA